jgi:hypothetical protein
MPQSQKQFPVEVSAASIFFYGASPHFRAMASPDLLTPALSLPCCRSSLCTSVKQKWNYFRKSCVKHQDAVLLGLVTREIGIE